MIGIIRSSLTYVQMHFLCNCVSKIYFALFCRSYTWVIVTDCYGNNKGLSLKAFLLTQCCSRLRTTLSRFFLSILNLHVFFYLMFLMNVLVQLKENLENALVLKKKRYKVYSVKRLFWHQLSFVYKTVSQISFNLLCSGDKKLLSELLWK